MGNYIGYTDKEKKVQGERLGTNGSAQALMSLFVVGYASHNHPDSIRARRAVRPRNGAKEHNPGKEVPNWNCGDQESVKQLIRLDGELGGSRCFWADIDFRMVGSGFFQKPPKCEIYQGILLPIILMEACNGSVIIPAGDCVEKVSKAWNAVLPLLEESPAKETLALMAAMAAGAANCHADLRIS